MGNMVEGTDNKNKDNNRKMMKNDRESNEETVNQLNKKQQLLTSVENNRMEFREVMQLLSFPLPLLLRPPSILPILHNSPLSYH